MVEDLASDPQGDEAMLSGADEEGERLWRGLASVVGLVAAIVLVVLVVLVAHSNRKRDAALERERHSYEVMLVTSGFGNALARTEVSLGHFVVNGDRVVGSAVSSNYALAGGLLDRLDEITEPDATQHKLVDELRALYLKRGKEFGDPAIRAYFKQGNPALNLFNDAGKSPTGPRIQRILKTLMANERAMLQERSSQAAAQVAHSNVLAAWLSGIGIVMVLGAAMMGATAFQATAQRHIARRNLRRAQERADTLEARVTERTRDLARALDALHAETAERAAAEAQLRQVQKMEAVGQLTGGIAHDFNNMLSVVVGGLDLARKRLTAETDEVARHIENAMEGASRAAALTRRLLAFSRAEPLLPERVEPAQLLSGMTELIDRTLGERVQVTIALQAGLWPIWIDPHQLENALLNLAVNARDAMEGAGTLAIAAENVVLKDQEVGELEAGDYLCIRVSDDGAGMPPEILERAFEPFFTTKPVGKGTGLGLSQIFGFVRQSEGDIRIDSRPAEGTTVTVYFPRARTNETRADQRPTLPVQLQIPDVPAARLAGTVLLVEDDPRVQRASVDALEELGFEPLPCDNGETALALLAQRPDIRLMITDVVMPGMTGPELVRRATPLHPDLPILFVTGFVGDAGSAGDLSGYEILRKPFTIAGLEAAVAAAFSRSANGSRRAEEAAATA